MIRKRAGRLAAVSILFSLCVPGRSGASPEPTTLALRGNRYKFIYYPGVWDVQELYDLEADPKERRNLIDVPEHQERIARMRKRLWDLLEASGGMSVPIKRGGFQANQRKGGQ